MIEPTGCGSELRTFFEKELRQKLSIKEFAQEVDERKTARGIAKLERTLDLCEGQRDRLNNSPQQVADLIEKASAKTRAVKPQLQDPNEAGSRLGSWFRRVCDGHPDLDRWESGFDEPWTAPVYCEEPVWMRLQIKLYGSCPHRLTAEGTNHVIWRAQTRFGGRLEHVLNVEEKQSRVVLALQPAPGRAVPQEVFDDVLKSVHDLFFEETVDLFFCSVLEVHRQLKLPSIESGRQPLSAAATQPGATIDVQNGDGARQLQDASLDSAHEPVSPHASVRPAPAGVIRAILVEKIRREMIEITGALELAEDYDTRVRSNEAFANFTTVSVCNRHPDLLDKLCMIKMTKKPKIVEIACEIAARSSDNTKATPILAKTFHDAHKRYGSEARTRLDQRQ